MNDRYLFPRRTLVASLVSLALATGCGSRGPGRVTPPSVDAATAVAAAMESFDGNGDGALDKTELAKCPPLAVALPSYDADKDGKISVEELTIRWNALFGAGSAYSSMSCTVTHNGRPLAGAVVKLRPLEALGDSLLSAEGMTDDQGVAQPGIPADNLPAQLATRPMVFPGLYYVEITHPQTQLPARYNTATELGCEVDPSSRSASAAHFDLKAK